MIDTSDVIAIVATVVSVPSVAVALLVYARQRRASHFEPARSLHADLTSGEVATARSVLAGNLDVAKIAIVERLQIRVEDISDGRSRDGFTELVLELRRIGRIASDS